MKTARYYRVTTRNATLLYDNDHDLSNDNKVFNILRECDAGEGWYLVYTKSNPLRRGFPPSKLPERYRREFKSLIQYADKYGTTHVSDWDGDRPIGVTDQDGFELEPRPAPDDPKTVRADVGKILPGGCKSTEANKD